MVVKVEVAVPLPMRSAWYASCTETRQRLEDLMFAMDVQWLAISLGSTAVGFVAMLVFACCRAAGLADRHLEELAGHLSF